MPHIEINPTSLSILAFQVVVLALIIIAFLYARRGKYRIHLAIMASAILLGGVSLFSWMLISLIDNWDLVVADPLDPGILITLIHAGIGSLTAGVTVFNVLNVAKIIPKSMRANVHRSMHLTFYLWILAFAFGFAFYAYYFIL